jgi:hypothetical protein
MSAFGSFAASRVDANGIRALLPAALPMNRFYSCRI